MSAALLAFSLVAIALVHMLARRRRPAAWALSRRACALRCSRRGRFRSTWTLDLRAGRAPGARRPVGQRARRRFCAPSPGSTGRPAGRIRCGPRDLVRRRHRHHGAAAGARRRARVPGLRAVSASLGARQRAARHAPRRRARAHGARPYRCWRGCTSTASRRARPISSRAASASAWRLPARSPAIPRCCCSMSRSRPSTA